MKKTILEIYALSICFVSTIFLMIYISEGLYSTVGVFKPELTMSSYTYEYLQSNERYRNHYYKTNKNDEIFKTEEEISKLRKTNYEIELNSEARTRLQSISRSFIYILLSSILLFLHWKLSTNARNKNT